jgi:excinuclease ABC subunit B
MPGKPETQSSFSIDEFIGEIEKAEDERLGKRLPQERLKNKRALDNAARRAAEAAGNPGKLVPQPLQRAPQPEAGAQRPSKAKRAPKNAALAQAEAAGLIVDKGKGKRSAATGMSLKAPKSKANSVTRPTNLDGFGETAQAGFGHVPSPAARSAHLEESRALSARDISREAAKNPEVMAQMRGAL